MGSEGDAQLARTIKLVAILVYTVAVLVLVPVLFGDVPPGDPRVAVASGLGLAVGLVGFVLGFRALRRRQLVRNTPTSTVRSLAVGTAEIHGEALPAEDPIEAPLSGVKACLCEIEIQEKHVDDDGVDWTTEAVVRQTAPFHLDDGTGQVLVDPDGARLDVKVQTRETVGPGQRPPEPLADWLHEDGGPAVEDERGIERRLFDHVRGLVVDGVLNTDQVDIVGEAGSTRRYEERVLEPGETAYVLGAARRRNGAGSARNEANLVMASDPSTGCFLVSDKAEERIVDEAVVRICFLLGLAVLGIPYGGLGLLRFAGWL